MTDLFGEQPHDPGSKVMFDMPPGMIGRAIFRGDNEEHRIWLNRRWGDAIHQDLPYPLLIGMNPSTATADKNDRTINREIGFVTEWGYQCFYKGNVGSYRATHQRDLLNLDLTIVHADNVPTLRALANSPKCDKIVLCCGKVPVTLERPRDELVNLLRGDGHKVWCFGLTDSGHPKHPLYQPKGTPLVEYVQ